MEKAVIGPTITNRQTMRPDTRSSIAAAERSVVRALPVAENFLTPK